MCLHGPQNTAIFHSTALTDWFLQPRQCVHYAVQIECSNAVNINLSRLRLELSLDINTLTIASDLVIPK
jgi:hypothetical protein